jgi:hypothetical protein
MQTVEITNAERLAALKALPLPVGAQFSIHEVTNANHKPHPYTIGQRHMEEAQKHGGIIGEAVCSKVRCAHPGCSIGYKEHTSESVCFIQVTAPGELKDVPFLQEFLVSIKDKANELGISGFAFVQAPKTYEPEKGEQIQLAQPSGSTEPSKLTKQQYKSFGPRPVEGYGPGAAIWAHVRYDDNCGNGHNSFAITGTVRVPRQREAAACGCLHDDLALAFPELAPFIKWHLCDSNGPMHYVSNTCYHASDSDYNGRRAGEPSSFTHAVQFGDNPIKHKVSKSFGAFLQQYRRGVAGDFDFEVLPIQHENRSGETYEFSPKYTFGGYADKWHKCPFDTEPEALDFLKALQTCNPVFLEVPTAWSEGKKRDLDAARNAAVWPEATEEELIAPGLKERLEARLPALLMEFRQAVESLGFTW